MATTTYVPIQTYTLTGLTTTVTFSSIPDTYTDLRLVCSYKLGSAATGTNSFVRLNGDTGTNYSNTQVIGTGSSTPAGSTANSNNMGVTVDVTADYPVYQWDFQNYANTTTYKTALLRQSAGNNQAAAGVYLWRNTNAINQITFTAADNSGGASGTPDQFAAGSTFTLYGIANAQIEAPKATGGIITYDNTYFYHTFGASGTFTPQQNLTCDYLVIAGGGGAGLFTNGGATAGGGAGGLRSSVVATGGGGSLESAINVTAQAYTITVGAGGPGRTGSSGTGSQGGSSTFSTITATGGGLSTQDGNGGTGGSGGGGYGYPLGGFTGGAGTTGQGYAGGAGNTDGATWTSSGGGGGAGGVGATCTSGGEGGAGGIGVSIPVIANTTGTGVATYYAGGGGGGTTKPNTTSGAGGAGGGGAGGRQGQVGVNGITNTGGGGGGAGGAGITVAGNGGSGLVVIRYLKA